MPRIVRARIRAFPTFQPQRDRAIPTPLPHSSGTHSPCRGLAYDALGRLTEAKDNDSIVQYTWDSLGRALTEKQGPNPFGTAAMTVTLAYDAEGNTTQIDYPSGFEAHRTFDALHRLSAIDDDASADVADFDLFGAGGRRQDVSFGNGVTSAWTYDGFRRPTAIDHADSASTALAAFDYAWDSVPRTELRAVRYCALTDAAWTMREGPSGPGNRTRSQTAHVLRESRAPVRCDVGKRQAM